MPSTREGEISEIEQQSLLDKLENYQQKLKIANRKNKSDKIMKYTDKVCFSSFISLSLPPSPFYFSLFLFLILRC